MEKFIPYEKLSKKKKRELDAGRRTLWAINPVTRRPENPKAYHRKKAQKWKDDSASVLLLMIPSCILLKLRPQRRIIEPNKTASRNRRRETTAAGKD